MLLFWAWGNKVESINLSCIKAVLYSIRLYLLNSNLTGHLLTVVHQGHLNSLAVSVLHPQSTASEWAIPRSGFAAKGMSILIFLEHRSMYYKVI